MLAKVRESGGDTCFHTNKSSSRWRTLLQVAPVDNAVLSLIESIMLCVFLCVLTDSSKYIINTILVSVRTF